MGQRALTDCRAAPACIDMTDLAPTEPTLADDDPARSYRVVEPLAVKGSSVTITAAAKQIVTVEIEA